MATQTLGYFGEKLDLLIRQGATFGPFEVLIKNPDLSAVNLTGCFIRGKIRKKALDTLVTAELVVTINPDQVGLGKGKFTFGLSNSITAAIIAGEFAIDAASLYVWDMEWEDAIGNVLAMFYGSVKVQREVTRV